MWQVREERIFACPVEVLSELYAFRPGRWLRPFLRLAAGEVESRAARHAQHRAPAGQLRRSVFIAAGERSDRADGGFSVSFRWELAGFTDIPRNFDGAFVVTRLPGSRCTVSLEGWIGSDGGIRPAADDVSAQAGRLLVHRLLVHLAAAVEARLADAHP